MRIPTQIVERVVPSEATPRQVAREFARLLEAGGRLQPVGAGREDPEGFLALGYAPKHVFRLFDTLYYTTHLLRDSDDFRYYVAYVVPAEPGQRGRRFPIHPRIFYKDVSLVWRSPTHVIRSEDENWIGKGELKSQVVDGVEMEYGAEETTDLPLEIQAPLDAISRSGPKPRLDDDAMALVLRNAPDGRFEPYQDFTGPRRRAMADRRNLVHGGRRVAWFTRKNDPASLRFAAGYEPDFRRGILERSDTRSRLYGGAVRKYRILSRNRRIQFLFMAGPRHVWIIPAQALTTEIMSYGLRTVDVNADDDLFVPGYEYHYMDESEDPPTLHSQIPEGYAGPASEVDDSRADASPWLDRLPVVKRFRKAVLGRGA